MNTMVHKATFHIAPVPASRARVTRWGTYFPKKYKGFRDELEAILDSYALTPSDELLYVKVDFHVQMAKSWSKKRKASAEGKYCDNNADIDNYIKAVLDAAEGRYYNNDKQIVMVRARKFWAVEGSITYSQQPIIGL
jgi:Holliday junction resolvase RusA-like endonuclease